MQTFKSVIAACGLALAASGPAIADQAAETFAVQVIYDRITAGDLEGATGLLTEDAIYAVLARPRPWTAPAISGVEAIGEWWKGMQADNGRFEVKNLVTHGNRAMFDGYYWGDRLEKIGMSPAEFDGVAVLRDGKVQVLLLSYSADYGPRLKAAMAKLAN